MMMDMMDEAKLEKLKELRRMLQKKHVESMDFDEDSIASDLTSDGKEPIIEEEGIEDEYANNEGEEEGEATEEEGLLDEMIEFMRNKPKGSPKKTSHRFMAPPKPSLSVSIVSEKMIPKKKKRV